MIFRRKPEPAPEPLADDVRAWLTEQVEIPADFGIPSPGSQPRYESLRCQWCQGVHFRACPRVRELRYHENGAVARVLFWPEGEYDDSGTIWPEQVFTDD